MKQRSVGIQLVLVVICACLSSCGGAKQIPKYQGRTLLEWAEQLNDLDKDRRKEAVWAIRRFMDSKSGNDKEAVEAMRLLIAAMYEYRIDVCFEAGSALADPEGYPNMDSRMDAILEGADLPSWVKDRPYLRFNDALPRYHDGVGQFVRRIAANHPEYLDRFREKCTQAASIELRGRKKYFATDTLPYLKYEKEKADKKRKGDT